jgi:hypothetical protein
MNFVTFLHIILSNFNKKTMKDFIEKYYPIILAFLSFLMSVTLWFTGNKLEGIFVGIWVPSILSLSIAIRQRRKK